MTNKKVREDKLEKLKKEIIKEVTTMMDTRYYRSNEYTNQIRNEVSENFWHQNARNARIVSGLCKHLGVKVNDFGEITDDNQEQCQVQSMP